MSKSATGPLLGITGHQTLSDTTRNLVGKGIRKALPRGRLIGVSSLAAGADQIFAEVVTSLGGSLIAVLPCRNYEDSFPTKADLAKCRDLLSVAVRVITMPFDDPSEEAYWQAGREIVRQADRMLAVWDGRPAAGLGGTADVVRYAHSEGKPVQIIWPEGASRE